MPAGSGQDDDLERLLREVEALNAEAERALDPAKPSGAGGREVQRRGGQVAPGDAAAEESAGLPAAVVHSLVVSGAATLLVGLLFLLLPFLSIGTTGLVATFLGALLASAYWALRRR